MPASDRGGRNRSKMMGKTKTERKAERTIPSRRQQRRPRFATLALSAALGLSAPSLYASVAMASCSISGTMTLETNGVLEDCTVAEGGTYSISAYGGAGGDLIDLSEVLYNGSSGGEITAQFSLMAGQSFLVVTGNAGNAGFASGFDSASGQGGQGTFFVLNSGGTLTPYLVAGGGGGDGMNASGYFEGYGSGGQTVVNPASLTGSGGSGTASSLGSAGGGGGYLTNSNVSSYNSGLSFVGQAVGSSYAGTGGQGGNSTYNTSPMPGGGGGGYDGGNAGDSNGTGGMGGTNYYNPSLATNVSQVAGASDVASPALGQLDFTLVSASTSTTSSTSVPEPPALSLFALSVASLFLLSGRKARQASGFA